MIILKAHVVISPETPDIDNGSVVIDNAYIKAVGPYQELRPQFPHADLIDLSDSVLLPGLVNAHTHLELSFLKDKFPYRDSFTDWIRQLTAARQNRTEDLACIIAEACRQSLQGGVTTIGDICYEHRAWPVLAAQPIRKTCFAECFGLTTNLEATLEYLSRCIRDTIQDPLLKLGISPHAPYSAGSGLYTGAAQMAKTHNLPLTTHLAETTDETRFLQTGSGPWKEYLQQINRWDPSLKCPHRSSVDYFLDLDLAGQPFLLAHVNYAADSELDALAKTAHSVAFCPRAHQFFRHENHPFEKMIDRGINVCLGTDSLASNCTLGILDEMRFLHRSFGHLPPRTILKMATLNGAKALGWDKIGSVAVGTEADLIAIPLTAAPTDPLIDVLQSSAQPRITLVRGQIAFSA